MCRFGGSKFCVLAGKNTFGCCFANAWFFAGGAVQAAADLATFVRQTTPKLDLTPCFSKIYVKKFLLPFMKKLLVLGSVFALFLLTVPPSACYYDNEVDQFGTLNCDTTNVRYSVEITNLLAAHCTNSCHIPQAADGSENYLFGSYSEVRPYALDTNQFLNRINSVDSPMPPSGLMNQCNRDKIRAWINAGAKDN